MAYRHVSNKVIALLITGGSIVSFSQAQKRTSGASSSLAYMRNKAGVGPWELWKTQPLRRRLISLLGAEEFEALQINMDPASPMSIAGGVMSSSGNREHMGYEEEGALIIDLDHDVAEVLMLHNGNEVKAWAEGGRFVPLPAEVSERVQHWPQPVLKRALASLQNAPALPQSDAPAAGAATDRRQTNNALDDIQAVFGGSASAPKGPTGTTEDAVVARIAQQFEISGLRLGMSVVQARAVVAGITPNTTPRVVQFRLTDLPGMVFTSGANYFTGNNRANQSISLAFTLSSSSKQTAIWGIGRTVLYDEDSLPGVTATISALRTKYGAESNYKEDPIMHERILIWIRDANGNAVPRNQAAIIADACGHLGVAPEGSQSDVTSGLENSLPQQLDCTPYTFLNATLAEWASTRKDSKGRSRPADLLYSLNEQVISFPLRRASYEATMAEVDAARKNRNSRELQKARTSSAPL